MDQQRLQYLIDKVLQGRASAQEQEELDQWYALQDDEQGGLTTHLDDAHKKAYGKQLFQNISQQIEEPQREQESIALYPQQSRSGRRYTAWIAAAAVVVLVAVGSWYLFLNKPAALPPVVAQVTPVWKTHAALEDVEKVSMPDGSTIWLNATSILHYDTTFANGKREVWLEGEAYFDVAHVDNKPFEVHTGKVTTRVLGTAFNIDAYNLTDSVTVTVTRGKVKVTDSVHESGILLPDDKLVYKSNGTWDKSTVKADNDMAWTSGQLVFRDMRFKEVATRLERKFGIQLLFSNSGIENCLITASFNPSTPLKEILDILATVNGSKISKAAGGNTYHISGKKTCL